MTWWGWDKQVCCDSSSSTGLIQKATPNLFTYTVHVLCEVILEASANILNSSRPSWRHSTQNVPPTIQTARWIDLFTEYLLCNQGDYLSTISDVQLIPELRILRRESLQLNTVMAQLAQPWTMCLSRRIAQDHLPKFGNVTRQRIPQQHDDVACFDFCVRISTLGICAFNINF